MIFKSTYNHQRQMEKVEHLAWHIDHSILEMQLRLSHTSAHIVQRHLLVVPIYHHTYEYIQGKTIRECFLL